MRVDDDTEHPIIDHPSSWLLTEFTYRHDPTDWRASHIDLVLERDGMARRFRFFAPQQLHVTDIPSSFGLCILDVSRRQLEGIGVRVINFEGASGAPTFWAASVVEVGEQEM